MILQALIELLKEKFKDEYTIEIHPQENPNDKILTLTQKTKPKHHIYYDDINATIFIVNPHWNLREQTHSIAHPNFPSNITLPIDIPPPKTPPNMNTTLATIAQEITKQTGLTPQKITNHDGNNNIDHYQIKTQTEIIYIGYIQQFQATWLSPAVKHGGILITKYPHPSKQHKARESFYTNPSIYAMCNQHNNYPNLIDPNSIEQIIEVISDSRTPNTTE